MLGNEWIGGNPVLAQRPRRTRFVPAHQARISHDISGEDRGETADGGHDLPGGKVP
jgi:hypothetical protein